jgi:hypothetical protein
VLLNLVVSKLENLESIRESRLCGLSISKVVDYFLVSIGLLDVVIIKVHYSVAVRENLTLHAIIEDHLLLPIFIKSLDLAIVADDLFNDLHIGWGFIMILRWELHVIVFIFFFIRVLLGSRCFLFSF